MYCEWALQRDIFMSILFSTLSLLKIKLYPFLPLLLSHRFVPYPPGESFEGRTFKEIVQIKWGYKVGSFSMIVLVKGIEFPGLWIYREKTCEPSKALFFSPKIRVKTSPSAAYYWEKPRIFSLVLLNFPWVKRKIFHADYFKHCQLRKGYAMWVLG